MIENRGKYFKNTSSFPLPKIPLVDSPKPASVDQMWNVFAVNITIKVNHARLKTGRTDVTQEVLAL